MDACERAPEGRASVLHLRQSKTGQLVDIALIGQLGELVGGAVGQGAAASANARPHPEG